MPILEDFIHAIRRFIVWHSIFLVTDDKQLRPSLNPLLKTTSKAMKVRKGYAR